MGVFSRLSTLIRSWINFAVEKAENPEAVLNTALADMEGAARAARDMLVAEVAEEARLKKELAGAEEQSEQWARRAVQAVQNSRDDLARQALERQQHHATMVRELEAGLEKQHQIVARAREQLEQANRKVEEARARKSILVATHRRNRAMERIHGASTAASGEGVMETFQRLERRIEDESLRLEVVSEMSSLERGDSLEQEFRQLEGGNVEDKLLRLKQALSSGDIALPSTPARSLPLSHPARPALPEGGK